MIFSATGAEENSLISTVDKMYISRLMGIVLESTFLATDSSHGPPGTSEARSGKYK
jgi:hypothetical protein